MHNACIIHDACTIHAHVYHSIHGAHHACMVLSSMNGTCVYMTPHTVNNNFGSKNSKQLQDRVVSKIQLRFIFKFSVNSAWRSVDQMAL